ncbi:MAG: hotdog fold thioesterase [Solirubrobacterales bacterium]|nr:hotdog fold thioesterase [Solirubrobacterales bacterium]MBV9942721.1 hotdog fold thioesterase [Solirubrobacterales bacterium]
MGVHPGSETDGTGFDALYGLEVSECSEELARGFVAVRDELRQPGGVVHGGVYGAIAEGLAVRGTAASVAPLGKLALGLANQTTVIHPIARGKIHATATRRHRGRTTWVWEVEMADDRGLLCVASRVTVSVRDPWAAGLGCPR